MPFDPTLQNLAGVRPEVRARAIILVNHLREHGLPAVVTSGKRTWWQQAKLIAEGKTTALRSAHLKGRAIDVAFLGVSLRGTPSSWWAFLGTTGEALGFRWGGRFREYDPVHFDL